ncbi:MAG: ATP-dependent metallopeptidase FtsH/Yme1/Tma family protein, partial [Coprococcus sp.]
MDNQKMNNNRPDQDPEGGNNKKDDMNKKSLMIMVVLAIAVMIIAQMLSGKIASASQKEVTYTEFMQDVKDGKVTKVELDSDRIYYEVKNQKNVKYYTGNVQDERLYEELDNAGVTYSRKVIDTTTYVMSSILSFVLPTVLMVAVMMIFYRFAFKGGGGV